MQVHYDVTVAAARRLVEVVLTVERAAPGPLLLDTPCWVPGNYAFVAYGRDVFAVEATDAETGAALTVRRDGWQGYAIDDAPRAVQVRYLADCSSEEFSEAGGVIGPGNAVLTGLRCLRVLGHDGPCTRRFHLPEGWRLHHPSGARALGEGSMEYPDYDILLDTPVVMGHFDLLTRNVRGTPFHFAFLDRGRGFDAGVERFLDQVCRVAESFHDIFGGFPFDDYGFVCSCLPDCEWGLEHLTSTMVGLGADVFSTPDGLATGVRVCAHELFHAWNVRRMRPAGLERLDFARGSFTDGLWLAEGFTRYYEFLACTRAGVYSPAQCFSAVVNYQRHLAALPGYARVSPADASRASYLNHDDHYPGQVNNAIDYYDAGMLVAFGIDAALRSAGPGSLDRVMRALFDAHALPKPGYTTDDVCALLAAEDAALAARVRRQVTMPGALAVEEDLRRLGFAVSVEAVPRLGLVLDDDDKGPCIRAVLDTGPAAACGIAAGDSIVGVDGAPFTREALRGVTVAGRTVTLTVACNGATRDVVVPVEHHEQIAALRWAGSAAQAARIAAWLGQDFAPQDGEALPLDFYENFHGVVAVA